MIRYLIAAGVFVGLVVGAFLYGDHVGAARRDAYWKAAESRQFDKGIAARSAAERAVEKMPAPGGKPCALRDPYDRDCAK